MKEQNSIIPQKSNAKIALLSFIILVIFGVGLYGWQLSDQKSTVYRGWLTGIVPVSNQNTNDSVLVAYNPTNNTTKDILSLTGYSSNNYGAVSPDGKYVAYTYWKGNNNRYLVVQSLKNNHKQEYYLNQQYPFDVLYLSWLPDSKRLMYVTNDVQTGYSSQSINILDITSSKIQQIDHGGIWKVPPMMVDGGKSSAGENINNQNDLDILVSKYGGTHVPINRIGTRLYVKFSAPMIAPDGKHIAYSATLFQDRALGEDKLFVASSIWLQDINGGTPVLVYKTDKKDAIGRVTWASDKQLAFLRYREFNGTNGQIDLFDLDNKQVETLVPTTEDHWTILEPIGLSNDKISFISIPKGKTTTQRLIVDTQTKKITSQNVNIHGWTMFWRFTPIW